jgi:VIT1/CCC1 family predicted Fe2+/Mn2+ transporter
MKKIIGRIILAMMVLAVLGLFIGLLMEDYSFIEASLMVLGGVAALGLVTAGLVWALEAALND